MHEGAIAAALIQGAREVRERERIGQVKTVTVLIGRLHHVVPEVLQNHYRILKKEHPPLSRSRLVIEIAPVQITCSVCGHETLIDRPVLACSSCSSTDIEVTGGREMLLKEIGGTRARKSKGESIE